MSNVREIIVLTGAYGAGAGHVPGEKYWFASGDVVAYHLLDNNIIEGNYRITKKVTYDQWEELRDLIKGDSILKITGKINGEFIELEEIIETNLLDKPLLDVLDRLKKPVIYKDEFLGEFTFDRMSKEFQKSIKWQGHSCTLAFEEEVDIKAAYELFNNEDKWNDLIENYIVKELLELKNEDWCDEDDYGNEMPPLTSEEFKARLKLDIIKINNNGDFDFWYDDGELFFGHTIYASGNIEKGMDEATIMG